MTTDLENNFHRIYPLRTLEMTFQSTKISKFSGEHAPDPPSAWPLQRSPDSKVIKKRPHDFIYLKSWTVFLCQHDTLSVQLL